MTVKQVLISFVVLFMVAVSGTGFCQNKVVVIPLMGKPAKNLHNVVTVAKKDGDFTDPVAAINSITDASADNPYLLVIGPGVYDVGTNSIVMKPYVNIAGSGQEVTMITGSVAIDAGYKTAIIIGENNAALTDFTVESTGGPNHSCAIYNYNASPRIERVEVKVSGGATCTGIYNDYASPMMLDVSVNVDCESTGTLGVRNDFSDPIMDSVTVISSGGDTTYGVYNYYSSPVMRNIVARAIGESSVWGVSNMYFSSPEMMNVKAIASGGDWISAGIINSSSSAPIMDGVTAIATNEEDSYGIYSYSSSSPYIKNSTMEGKAGGLFIDEEVGGLKIVNSKIVGGVIDESPDTQCRGNYDENLDNVDC